MRNTNFKNDFCRFIAHLFTKYSSHMRIFYTPHESKPSPHIDTQFNRFDHSTSPLPEPTQATYVQFPWHKIYALLVRKNTQRDRKKVLGGEKKGRKIIMENVLCMCNKANWKSEMNSGGISTQHNVHIHISCYIAVRVCVCGLYKYFVLLESVRESEAPKSSQGPSFSLIASDATAQDTVTKYSRGVGEIWDEGCGMWDLNLSPQICICMQQSTWKSINRKGMGRRPACRSTTTVCECFPITQTVTNNC